MATEKLYSGDGSDTTFDITFPYLTHADIGVSVGGVTKTVGSDYSITGDTVTFTTAPASGTNNVKLYRNTDIDNPEHEYSAGSSITAARLNENQRQALYAIEEAKLVTTTSGGITTGNKNDITVNSDTDWVIRNGVVEKAMLDTDSVGTDQIETNAVTAAEIAANAVGASELADNAVDTAAIADNAVTMAKLNSGALPTDITVASANLVNGTIATDDIGNLQITTAKLATATSNSLNPVGTVIWYAGSTAPAGYLKANGDTLPNDSTTAVHGITADWTTLYAIVGNKLPDLRGEFVRGATLLREGIDETGTTAHAGTGGPTFSGTSVLRTQNDKFKSHSHNYYKYGNLQGWESSGEVSNGMRNPSLQATTDVVGDETRPRNVALLACIKY